MKLSAFIDKLKEVSKGEDCEVSITDGYKVISYELDDAEIKLCEFEDEKWIDIGVGGLDS